MQNDQYRQNNRFGQNSQYGVQNSRYGIQNNLYDPNNTVYPNAPYPPVQYGPVAQPAPYQQAPSAVNSRKSKKTAMIFCIISNVLMVLGVLAIPFLFVMILAMGFGAVGETFYTALLIAVACALGPIASLALAIAAKVKNRKSIWAVVNMVISTILILTPVALGIIYVNDRKNNPKTPAASSSYYAYENPYYEEMNACLEEHDFDVALKDDTGRRQLGDMQLYSYTLGIYVSSEASEEKRSEVTEYLRQMRDICIKTDETGKYPGGMRVILEFYYFDPDNAEELYHPYKNLYIFADTPDDEIDVENYIDMALSAGPSRGSVRDKPVNEDVMIVVY